MKRLEGMRGKKQEKEELGKDEGNERDAWKVK